MTIDKKKLIEGARVRMKEGVIVGVGLGASCVRVRFADGVFETIEPGSIAEILPALPEVGDIVQTADEPRTKWTVKAVSESTVGRYYWLHSGDACFSTYHERDGVTLIRKGTPAAAADSTTEG